MLTALDEHYKYLPETELHEAIDEFMFLLKKRNNEGATAFASRFKTQLSRVQSLIAQERETSRRKRRKKVDEEANPLDDSSVEESGEDGSRSETPDAAAAADTASVPSASPGEREGSVRSGGHRSHRADGAGTAAGPTRSSGRGVRRPREEDEVDPKDAKDDTRMQRLLGTLERSTMRPRPVSVPAISAWAPVHAEVWPQSGAARSGHPGYGRFIQVSGCGAHHARIRHGRSPPGATSTAAPQGQAGGLRDGVRRRV